MVKYFHKITSLRNHLRQKACISPNKSVVVLSKGATVRNLGVFPGGPVVLTPALPLQGAKV